VAGVAAAHFDAVRAALDQAGIEYVLDPAIVRGLDYYTRTVFEYHCDRLGAQSQIGGGGRYDGLIELIGGPPTPGCGWAVGIERTLLALETDEPEPAVDVFVVAEDSQRQRALLLASELRRAGLSAELDLAGRAVRGQMRHADRLGARRAVILGDGGAQLRDMESGEQIPVELAEVVARLEGASG
jgi:histidyl-tRNA synthetase